ncbi:PepSY domain-containing protein [Ureibacillus sp. GCM10028918]|uniref:PepSY domain-containing protein n=1 Tax=Ureibacillus sp. GCM10028918 TaxID=3273429 RepID=UPI003611DF00
MLKKFLITGSTLLLLTACNNAEESTNNTVSSQQSKEVTEAAGNAEQITVEPSANIAEVAVSLQDAVAIFQKNHPEAKILSVDLDTSFGKYEYDVTGQDASAEYEMTIDATTKEVLNEESEKETDLEITLDLSVIIEPSAAIESASSVPEAKELIPESWSLDAENGVQIYTVNFEEGRSEVEVEVNAETGEILDVEIDE